MSPTAPLRFWWGLQRSEMPAKFESGARAFLRGRPSRWQSSLWTLVMQVLFTPGPLLILAGIPPILVPLFCPRPPPLTTASSPGLLGPVGIQPRAHWGKRSPASSVTVKRKLSCRELIGPPTPWNLTGLQYRIFQKASTVDLDDKPSACLATSHGAILLSGHCTHSASV